MEKLQEYLHTKIDYLKDLLSQDICVSRFVRSDKGVVYKATINGNTEHHLATTADGQMLEQLYFKQQEIKKRIKEIEGTLKLLAARDSSPIKLYGKHDLTNCRRKYGDWEKLVEVPNNHENKRHYVHNGKDYDSKSEVSIAEVYELLNIPFKHGVNFHVGGRIVNADFVPYIEETGDYFIHEQIGMDNGRKYLNNTVDKFEAFLKDDLIMGRDVLFTFESLDNFADKEYYLNCIEMMMKNILLM